MRLALAALVVALLALAYPGTVWAGGELPTPVLANISRDVNGNVVIDGQSFGDPSMGLSLRVHAQAQGDSVVSDRSAIYVYFNDAGVTWTNTRITIARQQIPFRGTATVWVGSKVSNNYFLPGPSPTATPSTTPTRTSVPSPTRTIPSATATSTVQPTPTPDIHISAGYPGPLEWPRGEYRTVAVAISVQNSISIFDWIKTEFTSSTCELDGVPATRRDYYAGTYTNVYHRVGVLVNAVLGMCRLNGRVTFEGSGRTLNFYTELWVVETPTPTPTSTVQPTATVQPSQTATATSSPPMATLGYEGGYQWQRGETRRLELYLSSPSPVHQWQGGQFTSTCGILGLPIAFYSPFDQSRVQYSWAMTIPASAPLGHCTIRGSVYLLGMDTTLSFYTELWVVEAPTPTATRTPAPSPSPTRTAIPGPTATPIRVPHAELRPPEWFLSGRVIEVPVHVKTFGHEADAGGFELYYPSTSIEEIRIVAEPGITLVLNEHEQRKIVLGYARLGGLLQDGEKAATLKVKTTTEIKNVVLTVRENQLANEGRSLGTAPASTYIIHLTMGDANGDDAVTILDFSLLVASFGKQQGQQDFDSRADFNRDNTVTILDFSILVSNFGRRMPGLG